MPNLPPLTKQEMLPSNPFEKDGKWYWLDETADLSIPFDTKEEAQQKLDEYIRWLNGDDGE